MSTFPHVPQLDRDRSPTQQREVKMLQSPSPLPHLVAIVGIKLLRSSQVMTLIRLPDGESGVSSQKRMKKWAKTMTF